MEEYLETLSWFGKRWPKYTKDEIFSATVGKRNGHAIAFETGGLQVLLSILKGPKGGITSLLIIVDPSQPIEVDKLICCDYSIRSSVWISLRAYVEVHIEKKGFDNVASKLILATMRDWKINPDLARAEADIIGFGETSIPAFSGGLVSPR